MKKSGSKDIAFLLKKSGIALTVKAGGMITQYIFIFTMAQLLGPGQLGSYTLAFTVVQLSSILALLGLDNLIIRKIAAARAAGNLTDLKQAYLTSRKITGITSLILAVLLYFASPFLANVIFRKPGMLNHLQFASIALPPFTWIVLHAAAFRGAKNMIGFTLFKTIIPLLNTALILIAFYSNSSITPVQGFTITVFIVSIGYFIVWNKFQSINEIDAGTQVEWRELIKQSLPMMITGSVFFILNWVDNLVIGIYRTETELGIYDTAFKISSASAAILMAVNAIQAPTFAEIHSQKDHQRLRKYVYNSTRLLFYATAPLTILLLIFPDWILSLFGKDFTPGAYPLQILAIGNFINCITGSVGILLMMTGYQLQYNRIIITAAVIGIGLNFLLVPILGIEGAAYSSTISKIIWNLWSVYFVYKNLGLVSIYLPGIKRPTSTTATEFNFKEKPENEQ